MHVTLGGDPAQACAKWHCIVDENMFTSIMCITFCIAKWEH